MSAGEWDVRLGELRRRLATSAARVCPRSAERPALRARAEADLALLARAELAGLLRRAARLRFAHGAAARIHPLDPLTDPDWVALRRRVRRELALARGAGLELGDEVRTVAARLAGGALGTWPDGDELARASLVLQETERGRLELGRGLLARGHHARGAAVLTDSRRRGGAMRLRWMSSEGLGWAAEARGEPRAALGWYERSAHEGGPAEVLVSARAMALDARESRRARALALLLEERLQSVPAERGRAQRVRDERRRLYAVLSA